MRKLIVFAFVVSIGVSVLLATASAQTVTSTLSGTVADPSGAVIPGAQVTLTDQATGSKHTTTANSSGHFTFSAIFPGTYDLSVNAQGFGPWEQKGIVLHQNESRNVTDIALKPGTTTQQVTVEAGVEAVPVDTGASSTTLNNTMVTQTAIQGRDAAELMRLMPGMAINSGLNNTEWNSALTQINNGPVGQFSANGTMPNGSVQLINNGSVITDPGNQGTQISNINQDMTQEVTFQDSAFDAEYAHGPVTFSAVGKRGSNAFHGELYGYGRNGSANSNNAFFNAQNPPIRKPIDHYWYYGGNIGGPVIIPGTSFNKSRNRAFFFFGLEHLNQLPAGTLHQYVVPTPQMMGGDFTAASMAPYTQFGSGSGAIPCAFTAGSTNWANFCQGAIAAGQITMYGPNGTPYSGAAYNAAVAGGTVPTVSGATISPTLFDPNGLALMKILGNAPGLQAINPVQAKGYNAQFLTVLRSTVTR